MNNDGRSSNNEQSTLPDGDNRRKRICRRHSREQIQKLEEYYEFYPNPDEAQRQALSQEVGLDANQIKFWFQNKRTQTKAQQERNDNIMLRDENEKLLGENEALLQFLRNVNCPACGGPPIGRDGRESCLQKLCLENAYLKQQRDQLSNFLANHKSKRPRNSLAYAPNPISLETVQPQPLSDMDIARAATRVVEELKHLFFAEEQFWVKSSVDETHMMIDQERYYAFSHAIKHFRGPSAHVESSKDFTVVPFEATNLTNMFLDSKKWKELFPTIVNKAETVHTFGTQAPIDENFNVMQVIWEQLHILSPLVPPREFMILRCCQKIGHGLWIIADMSFDIKFNFVNAGCYKRPSGCLIQALSETHSKVMWIEHVEVNQNTDMMYREALGGGLGYGAKRWTITLERMCERMALTSIPILPPTDIGEVITTLEGRNRLMKLGERMMKMFNEMLTMSGKSDSPQQLKPGVRISVRVNNERGQPPGLVASAATSLHFPLTPMEVFSFLQNLETRNQWDALSSGIGVVVTEIGRIVTGSSETNYLSIIKSTENLNNEILVVQDSYMDALGGVIIFAPLDMNTLTKTVSGEADPSKIEILPSGLIISSDGRGGTLLTLAFQFLISGKTTRPRAANERSVRMVNGLMSSTVERIKGLVNCPEVIE